MPPSALRPAAVLLGLILLATAGCRPAEKAYTVNLSVPAKIGEKSTVVTTSTTTLETLVKLGVGDQAPIPVKRQSQKRVVRLTAEVETLAVFPNGGVQQAALALTSLRVALDDKPETDVLPAGTKVVAASTSDGQVTFTVNAQPADDKVAEILRLVFEPGSPERTDQAKFGPKGPVVIGAAWPIDGALFAGQFKNEFGAASTCEGAMHLDAVTGEGPGQLAAVSGAVAMHGLRAPLPDPFVTKSGDGQSQLKAGVTAGHVGTDTLSMTLDFNFQSEAPGPSGGQLTATIQMGGRRETSVTYHP